MKLDSEIVVGILAVAAIGLILLIVVAAPYLEAKAFNDCTGGSASYFTAAFTELRVENCDR